MDESHLNILKTLFLPRDAL